MRNATLRLQRRQCRQVRESLQDIERYADPILPRSQMNVLISSSVIPDASQLNLEIRNTRRAHNSWIVFLAHGKSEDDEKDTVRI